MQFRGFAIVGRLVMVLGGVILLVLSCACISVMYRGWLPIAAQLDGHDLRLAVASFAPWTRVAIGAGAGVVAWLAVASAHAGLRGPAGLFELTHFPIGSLPHAGTLLISAKSMAMLTNVVSDRVQGVVTTRSRVSRGPRGWRVDLRVVVEHGVSLPKLTTEIRDSLGDALLAHTGLDLTSVRLRAQIEPMGAQRRVS